MSGGINYTEEEKAFLKTTIPKNSHAKTAELFNEKFERQITAGKSKAFGKYYGIKAKDDGRFKVGVRNNPSGEFLKGQRSHNSLPDGTISDRKRNNGEKWIKVNGKWVLYSHYLWKQAGREIPEGYVLCYRDGDASNVTIDNLRCVSRAVAQALIKKNETRGINRDVVLSIAELKFAIKEAKREQEVEKNEQ